MAKSGQTNQAFRSNIKWPQKKPFAARDQGNWRVADLCSAYGFPTSAPGGGLIGILELGGGWVQGDLDQFSSQNNLPTIQVTDVVVSGPGNSPGGEADAEVALDIEVAAAAYFSATGQMPNIRVYWVQNDENAFVSGIQQAAADGCDVLSISWGSDEDKWESDPMAQQVEQAAQTAAARGMVIFASSGDNSSDDTSPEANVDFPSSCPHIIGCGGTTKTRTNETVWGSANPDGDGTGGGYSKIFPAQTWQVGAPSSPDPATNGRMVPDVAANADPNTGYLIVVNGQEAPVGGTSAVAPFYAGLFAAIGTKLGFVTPTLWANPSVFTVITEGTNGGFSAQNGPSPCTGLGVPIGTKIAALFSAAGSQTRVVDPARVSSPKALGAGDICSAYKILKPILQAIELVPFFPADWKSAIGAFFGVMDQVCKSSAPDIKMRVARPIEDRITELDRQIKMAISEHWLKTPQSAALAVPHDLGSEICGVYKAIKPILDIIKTFVPSPWVVGIGIAEAALDQLCGTASKAASQTSACGH